jgi:hypothetical protein
MPESSDPAIPPSQHHALTRQWVEENWDSRAKPAIVKVLNRKLRISPDVAEDMAGDLVIKILESGSLGAWLAAGNTVSVWEIANWAYQDLCDSLEKQAQDGARRANNPALRTRSERRSVKVGGPEARTVHNSASPFEVHDVYDGDDVVDAEYEAPHRADDPLSLLLLKEKEEQFEAAIEAGFPQSPDRMKELYAHLREEKVRSDIAPEMGVTKARCATMVQNLRWCLRLGPEEMRRLRKRYKQ